MQLQIWLLFIVGAALAGAAMGYGSNKEIEKRQAGSCIHPPNDLLKKVACMASCALQNCATGSCDGRTCKCSGCDDGPVGPWKRTVNNNDEDDEELFEEAENEIEKRQAGSCVRKCTCKRAAHSPNSSFYHCIDPPNDVLKKVACMASCAVQNCATGSCHGQTCHCSRCEGGPVGPWK